MRFIRKQTAPIVKDVFGIEHPEITIKITSVPEDRKNHTLNIYCSYYHNSETTQNLEIFGFGNFVFNFNNTYNIPPSPSSLGYPTYSQVRQDIDIDNDGNIVLINPNVPNWILNQNYVLDFEGKTFGENWEIVD